MLEKNLQTELTYYMRTYLKYFPVGAYELKLCKESSWAYDDISSNQIECLLKVKKEGLQYKIPDSGNSQKPFDAFVLRGSAFLVLCFYKARRKKILYFIDIEDFINHTKTSKRKSLTEEDATRLAKFELPLNIHLAPSKTAFL